MESSVILNSGGQTANAALGGGVVAARDVQEKAQVTVRQVNPVKESVESNVSLKNPDDARLEAVRQAARQVVSVNTGANLRFTIYRDFSNGDGQFVTRFTNVETGEVVTVPTEQQLRKLAGSSADVGAIIEATV